MGAQVTSGAVSVGRQKLFHQQILNSSPLQMQIQTGLVTPQICGALPHRFACGSLATGPGS